MQSELQCRYLLYLELVRNVLKHNVGNVQQKTIAKDANGEKSVKVVKPELLCFNYNELIHLNYYLYVVRRQSKWILLNINK